MTDTRKAKGDEAFDLGQLLTTHLDFKDLALPAHTLDQVEHIIAWIESSEKLSRDWGFSTWAPGFCALFSGPSGTGKTLVATLIAQRTGHEILRCDLARVVSKYIGETEKNLSRFFDAAQERNAILFFDEADALFGKRAEVRDSHDRFANLEVSYLLQRIETFNGLVILSSNLKSSIDPAFLRRIQMSVQFERPDAKMRARLWESVLHRSIPRNADIDLNALAEAHELLASEMQNAVRFAAVEAIRRGADCIGQQDLNAGVASELSKKG